MKKLLFALMTLLALTACSSDPEIHQLTQQEKVVYAQNIKGEYSGRYTIVYTDMQTTDGGTKMLRETVDSVTFSVSDLTSHTVIFNNFPLRLLASMVEDSELSQALSNVPDMGLTGNYEFKRGAEDSKVVWIFSMTPVSLSLTYGGRQHNIVIQLRNTYTYTSLAKEQIVGGIAFEKDQQFQLEVSAVYEDDRLVQQFTDGWQNGPEMLVVFHFGL